MGYPSISSPKPYDAIDAEIERVDAATPRLSPRERDPLVWAAAYAAEYRGQAEAVRLAVGPDGGEVGFGIDVERCTRVADAAALAARPEPTGTPRHLLVWPDANADERTAERVLAIPIPPDVSTPAQRLAALEAAERTYLLAAGWRVARAPDRWIAEDDSVWPIESALRVQRDRDAGR
jgi:hypothetical protein